MKPIALRPDPHAARDAAMGSLTRACIAVAGSRLNPGGKGASEFARKKWDEPRDVEYLLRAASAPAAISVTGWAAEMARVATAFIDALVPLSAGADLLRRGLQLSFDGAAIIKIPSVTAPLADFVAEMAPIPVVQATSETQATLEACKFGFITVLTRETIESGNAEALVKQALLDAAGPSLDRRLFDANPAVPGLRPAGLLNGKTPITAAPGTGLDNMAKDLGTLAAAVAPYAGNGGIVFVMAPAQSVAAALYPPRELGYDVLTSTTLAAGTVIAIAANNLVSAMTPAPLLDDSRVAAVHMADPASAIASGTMAGPVTALFQSDKVGVRMRWPLAWALRDDRAIAFVQGANWP